jgi:hypothetical protein
MVPVVVFASKNQEGDHHSVVIVDIKMESFSLAFCEGSHGSEITKSKHLHDVLHLPQRSLAIHWNIAQVEIALDVTFGPSNGQSFLQSDG